MIEGDDSPVFVSLDQRVYLPTLGIWKKVIDLQRHDIVFSVLRGHVAVQYLEVIHRPIRVIELSIDGIHNYFVGNSGILVHNVAPLLCVGFAWSFGLGSFEFLGVNASIAILGAILGLRLFRERHNRDDKEHTTLNNGHAQIKCDFNIDIKPVIHKVLAQEITHTSSNEEHATEYTQQGKNNPAEPQQPESSEQDAEPAKTVEDILVDARPGEKKQKGGQNNLKNREGFKKL
jgi:hypothetical protein